MHGIDGAQAMPIDPLILLDGLLIIILVVSLLWGMDRRRW
jgi:hypothetical protein